VVACEVGIAMHERVETEIIQQGDVSIVQFLGSCVSDVEGIIATAAQIKEHIDRSRPRRVVFDFAGVKFFSSQVLGVLLEARAKAVNFGGEVVVCGIEPQLHRVFKITKLDQIFRFFPDRQAALEMGGRSDEQG